MSVDEVSGDSYIEPTTGIKIEKSPTGDEYQVYKDLGIVLTDRHKLKIWLIQKLHEVLNEQKRDYRDLGRFMGSERAYDVLCGKHWLVEAEELFVYIKHFKPDF